MLILSILTNFILANNSEMETEKSYLMFIFVEVNIKTCSHFYNKYCIGLNVKDLCGLKSE